MSTTTEQQQHDLEIIVGQLVEKNIFSSREEGDLFLETILNIGLTEGEMNAILQDLGNMARIPVVTDTLNKVQAWRNFIINIMIAGITGVVIEKIIPGIYYTLYEYVSTSFKLLLNAGYSKEQIKDFIGDTVTTIPTIIPRGIDLKSLFISGFNKAASTILSCVNLACSAYQKIASIATMETFNFITDLAKQSATMSIIKEAFSILHGKYDNMIADAIDQNVIEVYFDEALNSVYDIKESVDELLHESAENISNSKIDIKWNNADPDRNLDVSINAILNNKLQEIINNLFIDKNSKARMLKIEMLKDIIGVLRNPNNEEAISTFEEKYVPINFSAEEFRQLRVVLTLLTAPHAQPVLGRDASSQAEPEPVPVSVSGLTKSNSFAGPFPVGPNAMVVKYEQKNQNRPFDIVSERRRLLELGFLTPITINMDTGHQLNISPDDNTPLNRFVYDVLIMPMDENRSGNIYTEFLKQPSNIQNQIIEFIKSQLKSDVGTLSYNMEVDAVSKMIRNAINNGNFSLIKRRTEGGRRIKSRHYKKRRSTLKRRRVKGRRTRKGKKRRSTKRRR